jgi:hypothetical protein
VSTVLGAITILGSGRLGPTITALAGLAALAGISARALARSRRPAAFMASGFRTWLTASGKLATCTLSAPQLAIGRSGGVRKLIPVTNSSPRVAGRTTSSYSGI